jgi:GT2 family glycosyltransferase
MENNNNLSLKKTLKISEFSRSPVDIIIPFHGLYTRVKDLVKSILLTTKSNPYRITLIDDFSQNVSFYESLKEYKEIDIFRTESQLGFGGAVEFGYNLTKQPWVVILHSDCLIEDSSWLIEMGRSLLNLKDKNVRLVSSKSDNPGNWYDQRLKSDKKDRSEDFIVNTPLPLYCCMTHRDLFKKMNGFIKNYPYKGYEDEELFYRMKKFGFKQAICGKSWVKHFGSETVIDCIKRNPKVSEIIDNNRNLCIQDLKK